MRVRTGWTTLLVLLAAQTSSVWSARVREIHKQVVSVLAESGNGDNVGTERETNHESLSVSATTASARRGLKQDRITLSPTVPPSASPSVHLSTTPSSSPSIAAPVIETMAPSLSMSPSKTPKTKTQRPSVSLAPTITSSVVPSSGPSARPITPGPSASPITPGPSASPVDVPSDTPSDTPSLPPSTTPVEFLVPLLTMDFNYTTTNSNHLEELRVALSEYLLAELQPQFSFLQRMDIRLSTASFINNGGRRGRDRDRNRDRKRRNSRLLQAQTIMATYSGNAAFDFLPVPALDELHTAQQEALGRWNQYPSGINVQSVVYTNPNAVPSPPAGNNEAETNGNNNGGGGGANGLIVAVGVLAGCVLVAVLLVGYKFLQRQGFFYDDQDKEGVDTVTDPNNQQHQYTNGGSDNDSEAMSQKPRYIEPQAMYEIPHNSDMDDSIEAYSLDGASLDSSHSGLELARRRRITQKYLEDRESKRLLQQLQQEQLLQQQQQQQQQQQNDSADEMSAYSLSGVGRSRSDMPYDDDNSTVGGMSMYTTNTKGESMLVPQGESFEEIETTLLDQTTDSIYTPHKATAVSIQTRTFDEEDEQIPAAPIPSTVRNTTTTTTNTTSILKNKKANTIPPSAPSNLSPSKRFDDEDVPWDEQVRTSAPQTSSTYTGQTTKSQQPPPPPPPPPPMEKKRSRNPKPQRSGFAGGEAQEDQGSLPGFLRERQRTKRASRSSRGSNNGLV